MKTIRINGAEYVEAKADEKKAELTGEVCSQCAFGVPGGLPGCAIAIETSPEVFGGDCAERDVIYLPSPSLTKEPQT
jgi:hypothetical protein